MKKGQEQKAYKSTSHEKFVCKGVGKYAKSSVKVTPAGDETIEKIAQGCRCKNDKRRKQ
jgi:hypothetical protein